MKPRIAIPIPTTRDLAYNQRAWPLFENAVARSGGEPVAVPLTLSPAELRDLIATCDGVVLPGSPADVDPALYGAECDPATNPADPAREAVDYALLNDAAKHGKPVLGVCFGVQSMNVWRGGTLIQDLDRRQVRGNRIRHLPTAADQHQPPPGRRSPRRRSPHRSSLPRRRRHRSHRARPAL
jgi:putative glutamine amidotransferase